MQARAKEVIALLLPEIAEGTIRIEFTEFPLEQTAEALHHSWQGKFVDAL